MSEAQRIIVNSTKIANLLVEDNAIISKQIKELLTLVKTSNHMESYVKDLRAIGDDDVFISTTLCEIDNIMTQLKQRTYAVKALSELAIGKLKSADSFLKPLMEANKETRIMSTAELREFIKDASKCVGIKPLPEEMSMIHGLRIKKIKGDLTC
jgi:hypothetical protein